MTDRSSSSAFVAAAVLAAALSAAPALANPASDALRARASTHLYSLDHAEALSGFRQAVAADPEDAAAYRGLATSLWLSITFTRGNMTVDDYVGRVTKPNGPAAPPPADIANAYRETIAKAIALARQRIAANPNDADAHYQLGAAVGLRASYTATVDGSVVGAFRAAREAYDEHERVLALQPLRRDAELIVGTYRYIVAALAMPLRWMAYVAGFGGGRERGLRMIEDAAGYNGENQTDAQFALVLIYNRERRYNDALAQLALLRGALSGESAGLARKRVDESARRPPSRCRSLSRRGDDTLRRRSPPAYVRRKRAVALQAGHSAPRSARTRTRRPTCAER